MKVGWRAHVGRHIGVTQRGSLLRQSRNVLVKLAVLVGVVHDRDIDEERLGAICIEGPETEVVACHVERIVVQVQRVLPGVGLSL